MGTTQTENYVLPERGAQRGRINKYGFRTLSSGGSLSLRLDCAFHRLPVSYASFFSFSFIIPFSSLLFIVFRPSSSTEEEGKQQVSDWGRAPNAAVMSALARAKQRIEMIKNMKKEQ